MANTYLPAQQYIQLTLAELYVQQNLTGLITPFSMENMVGTVNDTVLYKTEGITVARDYEWRARTAPVIFDEIYKNTIPITLGNHMTVGNKWTDEERKFDMTDLRREIATPMAKAMVKRFDSKVAAAIAAANWAVTNLDVEAPTDANERDNSALKAALGIQSKLNAAGCPEQGRRLVLGANAFLFFAGSKSTLAYDKSLAQTVFQRGTYGTIADMDVIDGTGILGANDILALHPSWAVLGNAAPENPESLKFSERATFQGFSARLAAQYDLAYSSDRLLLNTFWGIAEIKDQYQRWTAADIGTATDGSEVGDVKIADGKPLFTGYNVRGGKGTFSQL